MFKLHCQTNFTCFLEVVCLCLAQVIQELINLTLCGERVFIWELRATLLKRFIKVHKSPINYGI